MVLRVVRVCCCILASALVSDANILDQYDCPLRELALKYTQEVVLLPWSRIRSAGAAALVSKGLKLDECLGITETATTLPHASQSPGSVPNVVKPATQELLYVSPEGDDHALGTKEHPLQSIPGAQAHILLKYPSPASRPVIRVLLRHGTYYNTSVSFSSVDSGASPTSPIIYAAALGEDGMPENAVISGGVPLNKLQLSWKAVPGTKGAFYTNVSGKHGVNFDLQDQMYIAGIPMVRARIPNGRPWIPNDGFNLRAKNGPGHTQMPDQPRTYPTCQSSADFSCKQASIVCAKTNQSQVTTLLGVSTGSAEELGSTVLVDDCYVRKLDIGNQWPSWRANQGFGFIDHDNATHTWMNKLDMSQNVPLWYGPWAGSIYIDASEHKDLARLTWPRPQDVVVHALADGEWGGVQMRGSEVQRNGSDSILKFQYGGFQQARGAMFQGQNRYYMEGSLEFLDQEGEWHFDSSSGLLYVFPPSSLGSDEASMATVELVLTQQKRLLTFVGSSDTAHVQNIMVANLTLVHTSAQFFESHEETSGGDYAIHRGAAVFVENANSLTFTGNNLMYLNGNGLFFSNSVQDMRVSANLFRFLGTSGVSIVGRTGAALGDARDGELIMKKYGRSRDNGVRLPKNILVDHNVFSDIGVWDKQSACYHKALAPGNSFLNNVCFNTSRHAVNFQDSLGGGGIVEGNLVFNLNRETHDTAAFNSWHRRVYLFSDPQDPGKPRLIPSVKNRWHRNMILTRNYQGIGYVNNGNGMRCDDGASWYNHSSNVLYNAGPEFNGGGDVYSRANLFIRAGWALCSPLPVGGSSYDTFVDSPAAWSSICGPKACEAFDGPGPQGQQPPIYHGDWNVAVLSDPAASFDKFWCGADLATWRNRTHEQEMHTTQERASPEYSLDKVIQMAHQILWDKRKTPEEIASQTLLI